MNATLERLIDEQVERERKKAEAEAQRVQSWLAAPPTHTVTHFWRVKKVLPERYGEPCRVLARGALNSCAVEFEDGYRVITNRWYVRRLTP